MLRHSRDGRATQGSFPQTDLPERIRLAQRRYLSARHEADLACKQASRFLSTLVIAHSEKQSVARAQRVAEVDPAYVELEDIAIQKSYEAEIVKSNLEFLEAEYKKWMMQTSYEKAQMGLI